VTLPFLGPTSVSGFQHTWWFVLLLVAILGLIVLYVLFQLARRERMLRFADTELVNSVAPNRPTPLRHLPPILLVASLLLLTIAIAGPTRDVRIPRNRAVVMLVIDVSNSMRATDVQPSRMAAAQEASKQFADELTPGINLGLIAYAGTANVLVSPTTNHDATKRALDNLQFADRTTTGEGIFTALSAISTVGAVIGGGDTPPPAHIVLFSDGKETLALESGQPKGLLHGRTRRQGPGGADLNDLVRHTQRLRRTQQPARAGARRRRNDEKDRPAFRRRGLPGLHHPRVETRLLDTATADRLRDGARRRQHGLATTGRLRTGFRSDRQLAHQPSPTGLTRRAEHFLSAP
jgi:Ca-activated chloride channel homolog